MVDSTQGTPVQRRPRQIFVDEASLSPASAALQRSLTAAPLQVFPRMN
jgi:hypothetical protein